MSPEIIFNLHLVLGYVVWLLCTNVYILPKLKAMNRIDAQRAIATLHSFRFFGLVFILPGVVGHNLPAGFATFDAYGDLATGLLAILALLTIRIRSLFWPLVVGFNLVGVIDIIVDYYHGGKFGLPALSGELGATYDRDCLCAHTVDYAFHIVLFAAPPSIGSNSRRGPSRFLNHASLSESPIIGSSRSTVENRAGGPKTFEDKNIFAMLIQRKAGEITLELTDEQYDKLRRAN
jgi:hypothetical protein